MHLHLHDELLTMARDDAATRERLARSGELFQGYAPEMERVHRENGERLLDIVAEHGWPGRSLVGEEGAEAAWLVAQHAIGLPRVQLQCLAALERAVTAGEAPLRHLAYLTDRIRCNQRRPQVYGTIHDWDEAGRLSPWPIEAPERVEERRRRAGLPPLAETTERLRREAAREGDRPPGDFAARQREIEAWARAAGWLD